MKFIERIKDKLWPISTEVRVVAAQFSRPEGAYMTLHKEGGLLEFQFAARTPGGMKSIVLRNLRLFVSRGSATLLDIHEHREVRLNRREKQLLGEAVHGWLDLDGLDAQMAVVA